MVALPAFREVIHFACNPECNVNVGEVRVTAFEGQSENRPCRFLLIQQVNPCSAIRCREET
jgi:hypothetical protein